MRHLFVAVIAALFIASPVWATPCADKAIGKNGKPLAGAAKASFIKKCEKDSTMTSSCADRAVDKNGKPLAGGAKLAFLRKCEKSPQ